MIKILKFGFARINSWKQRIPRDQPVIKGRKGVNLLSEPSQINEDYIEAYRSQRQEAHTRYKIRRDPEYTQTTIRTIHHYGVENIIVGTNQDDRSTNALLAVTEDLQPQVNQKQNQKNKSNKEKLKFKSSGMNPNYLRQFGQSKDFLENYQISLPHDITAQEQLIKFFNFEFQKSVSLFEEDVSNFLYREKQSMKLRISLDELSVAKKLIYVYDRYLFFGKPDSLILLEDLVLRLDLQELQSAWDNCLSFLYKKHENPEIPPLYETDWIHFFLQRAARLLYPDLLFEKHLIYLSSITRFSARNLKQTMVTLPNELVDKFLDISKEPLIPDYTEVFRSFQKKSEQAFDYQERIKQILQVFPQQDQDSENIQLRATEQRTKFDYRKNQFHLFENIGSSNADEILQKFVILTHLIDPILKKFVYHQSYPFQNSIYHDVFIKQYQTEEKVLEAFRKINEKYQIDLHRVQNHIISKIDTAESQVNDNVQSFKEQLTRIERQKDDFQYQIVVGQISRKQNTSILMSVLFNKVFSIIEQREQIEKINQDAEQKALRKFLKKQGDIDTFQIVMQLINEANLQLGGIAQLPGQMKYFLPYVLNSVKYGLMSSFEREFEKQGTQKFFLPPSLSEQEQLKYESHNIDTQFLDKMKNFGSGVVIGEDQMPENIDGKSIEELVQMGFVPITKLSMSADKRGTLTINPLKNEQKQRLKKLLKLAGSDVDQEQEVDEEGNQLVKDQSVFSDDSDESDSDADDSKGKQNQNKQSKLSPLMFDNQHLFEELGAPQKFNQLALSLSKQEIDCIDDDSFRRKIINIQAAERMKNSEVQEKQIDSPWIQRFKDQNKKLAERKTD